MIFSTRRRILAFDDKMPTGKYKGSMICFVMAIDPEYLRWWVISNSDSFNVTDNIKRCIRNIKSTNK